MPVQDGNYRKLTKEEIKQRFEANLSSNLDATAQPGDLVTKQLDAEAETLARNQEEALQRVYNAAYLEDATGKELDKVVDVIGLSRDIAQPATGTVEFSRSTPAKSEYTIPTNLKVQTSGSNPIEFKTTEQNTLAKIDKFENGNLNNWEGDLSPFSVISTSKLSGTYALEVPSTDGSTIQTKRNTFTPGSTFTAEVYPNSDSVTGFQFARQDNSNYFECVLNESSQDLTLRLIEGGSVVSSSTNSSVNIPADSASYLEVRWGLYEDHEAVLYSTENRDNELCSVTFNEPKKWTDGTVGVASHDANATCLLDTFSTRSVIVNIEGIDTGTITNVGPDTIRTIPNGTPGVEQVRNTVATGNPNLDNTNFNAFVLGEETETDEELRERAFNTTSIGGAASFNAISTELRKVDGVQALTIYRNRKDSTVNGLPPHSFEPVVYGGSDEEIANVIFNTASIDSHDVGGVNGTKKTYTIQSDVSNDTEEIAWSRPESVTVNINLNIVVDDTYIGDAELRSIIVNYIGGTGIDGNFVTGLDVGEDIYTAVLKRKIVSPEENGIWEVDNLVIDSGTDGNDDTTTTTSGAEILAVADNEVAITNARDGSISISTTQK